MTHGELIIEAICRADALQGAEAHENGAFTFIWRPNAPEQVEAALREAGVRIQIGRPAVSWPWKAEDVAMPDPHKELRDWLAGKLAEAEKAVRAREQMAESYLREETPEELEALRANPNVICTKAPRGKRGFTREEMEKEGHAQKRIAERCRQEVRHFRALLELISSLP